MNCKKCNTVLNLSRILFKNNKTHLRTWCQKCRKSFYVKQTKENLKIFEETEIKKSKPLRKIDARGIEAIKQEIRSRNVHAVKPKPKRIQFFQEGITLQARELGRKRREARKERKLRRQRKSRFSYKKYIQSDAWRIRCEMFYRTHHKICAACGNDRTIHLHHMTYAHLGEEHDADLVPLCRNCHDEYHEQNGVQKDMLWKTKEFIRVKSAKI